MGFKRSWVQIPPPRPIKSRIQYLFKKLNCYGKRCIIDITERKRKEMRQAAQFALTCIFSESVALRVAFPEILKVICEGFGWELGELWTVDHEAKQLHLECLWHVPSLDASEFEEVSRTITFSPGIGLPGRVWASGEPAVWISDVVTDSNFPRAAVAQKTGLHGAVAFPLMKGGWVIGVMLFFSKRIRPPDKELFDIMADTGRRIGFFISQKITEESLRASEHKYRILHENLPQKIFHKDSNSVYVSCNENYARDLKINSSEVAGKTDYDFYPKELAEKYRAEDRSVIESCQIEEFDEKYIKDGLALFLHKVKTPLKDKDGNVTGIIGIFWDITERKRMEDQLRELSYAVEQSPISVVITDTDGDIRYVNPMFTRITGYKLEEVIGKNPRILKSDKTPPEIYKQLWDTITTGGEWQGEFCNKKKNGEIYYGFTRISSIKGLTGKITHFIGFIDDITKHKQMEEAQANLREQLYHAQKLESVGVLAGGIAHDFNNILTAIVGYASLAHMKMKEGDTLRGHIQQILNSAERAANLTSGLLAFSRKQPGNPEPLDLSEIIIEVESLIKRVIREDITIKVVLTGKECNVKADGGQLEQVLLNLASNARDAMPEGGTLTIGTDVMEMDDEYIKAYWYREAGRYALITVSDTGVGMDERTRERIFEPFFTTKEVGKGTGLGLAIVYGIIKQHNGYINVHSELGRGTTFRIYLPLVEPGGKKEKKKAHVFHSGGTETILVAEDDKGVRKLTRIVLEQHGYTVIEAVYGEDAVRKDRENRDRVPCVLLDVIMPNKNGKEAYDAIKEMRPDVKAIFMSGYSKDIVGKKLLIDEKVNLISKPVSPTELLGAVREALDS